MPSSLALIAMGGILLFEAWRGHVSGQLHAGLKYLRPLRPTRANNPLAFYSYLLLYLAIGAWLMVWGARVLLGEAPPPRWR